MTQFIIVLVIYALYHVISYLAKVAAKRKEQEQMRQAAEQRRMAMSGASPLNAHNLGDADNDEAVFQPPVLEQRSKVRSGRPLDDLVANRRKQLEQLRNRRESQRTRQPQQVPTGNLPPTLPPQQGSVQTSKQPAPDQFRQQKKAQQQRLQREREQAKAEQRARQAQIAKQQREAKTQDRPQVVNRTSPTQPAGSASKPEHVDQLATKSSMPNTARQRNLIARLHDRSTLRELFIMKELLDPPVALRESPQRGQNG